MKKEIIKCPYCHKKWIARVKMEDRKILKIQCNYCTKLFDLDDKKEIKTNWENRKISEEAKQTAKHIGIISEGAIQTLIDEIRQ